MSKTKLSQIRPHSSSLWDDSAFPRVAKSRRLSCPHGASLRWLPAGAPAGAVVAACLQVPGGYSLGGVPPLEASEHPGVRASLHLPHFKEEEVFLKPWSPGSSRRLEAKLGQLCVPGVSVCPSDTTEAAASRTAPMACRRVRASSRVAGGYDPLLGGLKLLNVE